MWLVRSRLEQMVPVLSGGCCEIRVERPEPTAGLLLVFGCVGARLFVVLAGGCGKLCVIPARVRGTAPVLVKGHEHFTRRDGRVMSSGSFVFLAWCLYVGRLTR